MSEQIVYQIAFSILFRNRIRKALQLLKHYGTIEKTWCMMDETGKQEAFHRAEQEAEFVEKHQIQTFWFQDEDYPYRLKECPDKPLMLFAKGNVHPNQGRIISIVGTRGATDRGKELTRQFVLDLAAAIPDLTIVSGLAYGIDVAAHRAAIEAGISTYIIPAHGIDRIYPALHRPVAIQSLQNGGIITEYPSGTDPLQMNFVARNRIVAGLADAVVVVESKSEGGSLITAQMAIDYNRELFAFPGRPGDVCCQGCNELIRDQKASLIQSADDLIRAMQWRVNETHKPVQTEILDLFTSLTPEQHIIMDKLHEQEDGMHINLIVMETGLPYSGVSADLMMMEVLGVVKSLPGGIYRALK